MAVLIQFFFLLLLVPILEDDISTMQDPYSNVEEANPLVVFIIEVLFVTFLVNCFCLYIFSFLDVFKDEDTGTSGKSSESTKPSFKEYKSRDEETDLNNSDRLNEHLSVIDLLSDASLTVIGFENVGYESTNMRNGELDGVTKQNRYTVPFKRSKKKSYKSVLVPSRHKINLLVILRRKYAFKKKVQACCAVRYTSLNEILLSGNCVEINDLYVSVTNFDRECSTSQIKEYDEIDFENAVKIIYAPTKEKIQDEKFPNVPHKKKQQKSDLNEN